MGFAFKGTMKLRGIIRGNEVSVLIDSGAIHNFIHQALVKKKKILIENAPTLGLPLGMARIGKEKDYVRKLS